MCLGLRSLTLFLQFFLWNDFLNGFSAQEITGNVNEIGACYSLQSAMETFEKPEYRFLPQVRDLLETYRYNCKLKDMNSSPKTQLFIVVEAPRRRKRFLIAKRLAKFLGAAIMFSPPMGWAKYRGFFNRTMELRRAFHSLSLYGSANNAMQYLGSRPVVMSGFWLDQATFSIAKKYFPDYPPPNSTVFRWPADLIRPDYTFFVNEPLPKAFVDKRDKSIRYQILQVYRRWNDPPISELYVDEDIGIPSVVEEMLNVIKHPPVTSSPINR